LKKLEKSSSEVSITHALDNLERVNSQRDRFSELDHEEVKSPEVRIKPKFERSFIETAPIIMPK